MIIWLPLKEFPEYFEISNTGLVKSVTRVLVYTTGRSRVNEAKVLKPKKDKDGYLYVGLRINRKRYWRRVHRMVAETFIPNPQNKPYVNHIDSNVCNNHLSNLEWCTQSENVRHAIKNGAQYGAYSRRKINQLDKDGKFIRSWESTADAIRGGYPESIWMALQDLRANAGGYKWEYA